MGRPAVSVIVPLHGDRAYAERARDALAALELGAGDELIVADNTGDGVARAVFAGTRARVVDASGQRSSYFARNAARWDEAVDSARPDARRYAFPLVSMRSIRFWSVRWPTIVSPRISSSPRVTVTPPS